MKRGCYEEDGCADHEDDIWMALIPRYFYARRVCRALYGYVTLLAVCLLQFSRAPCFGNLQAGLFQAARGRLFRVPRVRDVQNVELCRVRGVMQ